MALKVRSQLVYRNSDVIEYLEYRKKSGIHIYFLYPALLGGSQEEAVLCGMMNVICK